MEMGLESSLGRRAIEACWIEDSEKYIELLGSCTPGAGKPQNNFPRVRRSSCAPSLLVLRRGKQRVGVLQPIVPNPQGSVFCPSIDRLGSKEPLCCCSGNIPGRTRVGSPRQADSEVILAKSERFRLSNAAQGMFVLFIPPFQLHTLVKSGEKAAAHCGWKIEPLLLGDGSHWAGRKSKAIVRA